MDKDNKDNKDKDQDEKLKVKLHSKEVYNKGLKPIIVKQTLKEKIVLHPKKSMRFENKIAEILCRQHADLEVK